jgi:sugar O-acyltransferase (sialic acid O-acetyltransferase NeuD family)
VVSQKAGRLRFWRSAVEASAEERPKQLQKRTSKPKRDQRMVRDLLILGAGGSGREVAEAIEDINSLGRKWNLLGFLDDDAEKHGKEFNGHPVLGAISTAVQYLNSEFVVVLGNHRDLKLTKTVLDRLSLGDARFATIVHPTARLSKHAELGPGTMVLPNCVITANARIGRHVLLLFGSQIGHDCTVEDYVVIAPNAVLAGGVCVREGCYIGANATLLQKTTIGPWSCVGMGAAVFSNVGAHSTVVGNPARLLRDRA